MLNLCRITACRFAIVFSFFMAFFPSFAMEEIKTPNLSLAENHLIFSGSSNGELAEKIVKAMNVELSPLSVGRFNDGEISVQYGMTLRDKYIYLILPTCKSEKGSVNDAIMELCFLADAANRASVKEITAVIPYYGYARQDRKTVPCVPISASVVATIIENSGVDRVLCVDLHCGQIQGFFKKIPVDNLYGSLVFRSCIKDLALEKLVIVSPDAGGMERANKFSGFLRDSGVEVDSVAMIYKKREKAGVVESSDLLGDVRGKNAIIVDDMCDTGGTLAKAASELKEKGAIKVYACITHGVFSLKALENIQKSAFDKVFVTDTIPLRGVAPSNLEIVSVAPLLAEAICRISQGQSVSEMFIPKE